MDPDTDNDAAREVIDQTGLTGVYDFELKHGFLPLAGDRHGPPRRWRLGSVR
jgi:hypothetical protein